jgi:meso-butanediol dehydrogenase / (S,S)-butanediol dehydrogenase / diacetyl reductase
MAGRLSGKVAIVTGAGSGIGAATALRFAREGARVVLLGRRIEPLERVAAGIARAGGVAETRSVDVTDEAAFAAAIDDTARRHGRLDVLVNNAYGMVAGTLERASTADWHATFRATLDSVFFGVRAALPRMAAQGGGAIVNVSSTAGHAGQAGIGAYASAKAALENLTRTAAVEAAPHGVRVNSVAPGVVATENTVAAFADPRARAAMERCIPLGRFGNPDEIASGIVFLASDEASFVTGACLIVDGGQRASLGAVQISDDWRAE